MELKIKRLSETATIPQYATAGAACFDLHADVLVDHPTGRVGASEMLILRTGLAFEIPEGWAMMIYSRSGAAFKSNIRLANCVGVIDSDFTGEVKIKLTSDDNGWIGVDHGDRIAQAMLVPITPVTFLAVDEIKATERGDGGFGSTGTGLNVVTPEEEQAANPIMTSRFIP